MIEKVERFSALPKLDTCVNPRDFSDSLINLQLLRDSSKLLNNACLTAENFPIILNAFGDKKPVGDLNKNIEIITLIAQQPTILAEELQRITGVPLDKMMQTQKWIQQSRFLGTVMRNHYYPNYLLVRYAQSFLGDLVGNEEYLEKVEQNKPIAPKRLEIHATDANCNYRCAMCLWHVNSKASYDQVTEKRLLDVNDWKQILTQTKEMGTETVIFSGGGEPLLRRDSAEIIEHGNRIGLSTMIYTNGSMLNNLSSDSDLYKALLRSDWLRVSLHAASEERYSQLVKIPQKYLPFTRVINGIKRLKDERDSRGLPLRLGIGFVIQSLNYDQVEDITNIAHNLDLDFLNLRVDCIDITEKLTQDQETELYNKLKKIRDYYDNGNYGKLDVDFADSLIAQMSDSKRLPKITFSSECKVHLYRSAINPYGRVSVCDLAAEPFFSRDELTLGYVTPGKDYKNVLEQAGGMHFNTKYCDNCMPGQQAINALWYKVLADRRLGINPNDQPLLFKN